MGHASIHHQIIIGSGTLLLWSLWLCSRLLVNANVVRVFVLAFRLVFMFEVLVAVAFGFVFTFELAFMSLWVKSLLSKKVAPTE